MMELNPLYVNIIAVIAILTGLAVGIWWVIGLYFVHTRAQEDELPEVELPGMLHEVISGLPAAAVIFYIFTAITMIVYVLYIWLGGVTY